MAINRTLFIIILLYRIILFPFFTMKFSLIFYFTSYCNSTGRDRIFINEKEIIIKTPEVEDGIKKEIIVNIVKDALKENNGIYPKDEPMKIKKTRTLHKKQLSKKIFLEDKNLADTNNLNIESKKISLINRIWNAIKAPFSSFLFNLGF